MPLITCQLCGTQQENAWDCAACGHPLHERPVLDVQVEAVPGLELTGAGDAGNVPLDPVPGLETTSLGAVSAPDAPPLDIETTSLAHGAELPVAEEAVPGLETTALEPPSAPTAAAAVACRYCGTPWQEAWGIFCARCGMRLPLVQSAPRASAVEAAERRGCPSCGTPRQVVGEPCTGCGQRVISAALS